MLLDVSTLIATNPPMLAYGVSVADVEGTGVLGVVVAGFGEANRWLGWDGSRLVDHDAGNLADADRQAIGVAAADLDGDGAEEVYVLNSDTFAGAKRFDDRLFDRAGGVWTDLLEGPHHAHARTPLAGRSVACLDRFARGRYGFLIASYGGPFRLIELGGDGLLTDAAPEAGLDRSAGGRALLPGPLTRHRTDVLALNEQGPNFWFRAMVDGTFIEGAEAAGIADPDVHGRGVALVDPPEGAIRFGFAAGSWEGPNRLFMPTVAGGWRDAAAKDFAEPGRVRTVIAADLDNDGFQEILTCCLGEENRLHGWRDGAWTRIDPGDAGEADGLVTGGAVCDLDGDGHLEVLLAHGEAAAQPLSLYHARPTGHSWVRIAPRTAAGAPARGALVELDAGVRTQRRAIDSGSGYLCQSEPVAHFGLGSQDHAERARVTWPDGAQVVLDQPATRTTHSIPHPQTPR